MRIELYLNANTYVTHNEIIVIPEEKVELLFKSSAYAIGTLLITVKRGDTVKQYKLKNETALDITDFCKIAGMVEVTAQIIVRGESAKLWQIEPFCVKEISGGFEVMPEIEYLKQRVSILERAVTELSEIITNS